MLSAAPAVKVGRVIQICVDTSQPPTGRVVVAEGEPAQPFVGWLQLLAILAAAFDPPATVALRRPTEAGPPAPSAT